jgi:osmoprotectant transport system permease protein
MTPDQPIIDWAWIGRNVDLLLEKTGEHALITVLAVVIGLLIAVPLTLAIRRWRGLAGPVLGFTGALYVIPSLALFAFLIPITGLSLLTTLIAMVGYTLLILIRNTLAGLDGVTPELVEAAAGLGYSPAQRLWRIEAPLALPVVMAGIRLATVSTIGLVAVAGVIGEGGLGDVIINYGIHAFFATPIIIGTVLAATLALAADAGLLALQRVLSPWAERRTVAP